MSTTACRIAASPEQVFDVLLDPYSYADWVVGMGRVRYADPDWPSPGAAVHHRIGVGLASVTGHTSIVDLDPPKRITLRSRAQVIGPLLDVDITLEPDDGGTTVTVEEHVVGHLTGVVWNPLFDGVAWARNILSLQRLKVVVEATARNAVVDAPHRDLPARMPDTVGAGARWLFGALSTARGGRIVFREGELFEGSLKVWPAADVPPTLLLSEPGPYPVVARLSRGLGLPQGLPDVLGLAIKIPDVYGPGADQDLLFASSPGAPVLRRAAAPATGFFATTFSSLLPYQVGDRSRLYLGAIPDTSVDVGGTGFDEAEDAAAAGTLRFQIALAGLTEPWEPFGVLYLTRCVEDRDVQFSPWNTGGGIRPAGPLNALREAAYFGAQLTRRTDDREIGSPV